MTGVKLTPRKAPRQHRARATVDAILIAAERLTVEHGVDGWTTNHVAELAGVSIGSLYQYFPGKESLLTALYLDRRGAALAALGDALTDALDRDPSALGLVAARALVRAWGERPALDGALRAHLVAVGAERKLAPIRRQTAQLFAQFLARRGGWPAAASQRLGLVVARLIDAAMESVAAEHPDWLADPDFVRELAALLQPLLSTRAPAVP